jgi:hypothetical protein
MILNLRDFIESDLLVALKAKICSFCREEGDKVELASSITKQQPVFLHIDSGIPKNSRDILRRFEVVKGWHQVNLVIFRAGTEKIFSQSSAAKGPSSGTYQEREPGFSAAGSPAGKSSTGT